MNTDSESDFQPDLYGGESQKLFLKKETHRILGCAFDVLNEVGHGLHEKIYEKYIDAFVKEVQSWKLGNPNEEGVYIGPLTRKTQLSILKQQVNEATEKDRETGGRDRAPNGRLRC